MSLFRGECNFTSCAYTTPVDRSILQTFNDPLLVCEVVGHQLSARVNENRVAPTPDSDCTMGVEWTGGL